MPGVVRRQTAGAAAFGSGQAVRVSLGVARIFRETDCISGRLPDLQGCYRSDGTRVCLNIVPVAGQLCFREGSGADSAGNTRPSPSTPRLSPLRRGSHTARRSMAAGCWRCRFWPQTGCGYGTENLLSG